MCAYYVYDEDFECYMCDMSMDEDEAVRLMYDLNSKGFSLPLGVTGMKDCAQFVKTALMN